MSKYTPRWTDRDRQAYAEQRLRAQTIPGKRFDGPKTDEWDSPLCRSCIGDGCARCQQTGYAGGREP